MNKTELIEKVAQKANMTKADTEKAVNAFIDTVTLALVSREKLTLTGFGCFTAEESKARIGRNPRTGAEINIPATYKPKFKPGKGLKEAVK